MAELESSSFALPPRPSRPTAVDLFSGAGGASVGLVKAGFDLLLGVDSVKSYSETHRMNCPGQFLCGDLRGVESGKLMAKAGVGPSELDVLFAGPPCQGFSMIGPRVVWDERNNLFSEVLRIARDIQPKAVVIENVPGLLTLGGGAYIHTILEGLQQVGYRPAVAELVAAQYGAPQLRWRVFIVAWRSDLDIEGGHGFPLPTHGQSGIGDLIPNCTISPADLAGFVTTGEAISDLPAIASGEQCVEYTGPPTSAYQIEMRKELGDELYNHYSARLSEANLARLRMLAPGQDWRDLPFEMLPPGMQRALRKDHTRRFRRMMWEGVPRSIITRFRDPKSGEYTHPSQDRTLSIREAARIQGFPDWFQFHGDRSSQYEQVGNAVPAQLAEAVAGEVARNLSGESSAGRIDHPFRRRPYPSIGRYGQLLDESSLGALW